MQKHDDFKTKYKKRVKRFTVYSKLDEANLSKEMATLSSYIFHVGQTKADAEDSMDRAKDRLAITKAKVDKDLRQRYSGKTRISEAAMTARITRHKDVVRIGNEYREAKWLFNVCWAAMNSLNKKSEQLIAMANDRRKELEYGMRSTKRGKREKRVKNKISRFHERN